MNIAGFNHVRVPEDVLVSEVGGESVLLDLKSEQYFGLDEMGTEMWSALTAAGSVQGAYDTLLAKYDVDAARLHHDLQALVEKLAENGLLELEPAG